MYGLEMYQRMWETNQGRLNAIGRPEPVIQMIEADTAPRAEEEGKAPEGTDPEIWKIKKKIDSEKYSAC